MSGPSNFADFNHRYQVINRYWHEGWVTAWPMSQYPFNTDWHHCVVTDDGAGTCRQYMDGVQVATTARTPPTRAIDRFVMGGLARYVTASGGWQELTCYADLCQVAVYTRALSAQEVERHYLAAVTRPEPVPEWAPEIGVTFPELPAAAKYRAAVHSSRPVGYWPLDEPVGATSAADVSGGGRDGTANGGATFGVQGPFGRGDRAVAFRRGGAAQWINVPPPPVLMRAFSVECWLRFDASGDALAQNLFGIQIPVPAWEQYLEVDSSGGGYMEVWFDNLPADFGWDRPHDWHHLVFTNDGVALSVYMDGTGIPRITTTSVGNWVPTWMGLGTAHAGGPTPMPSTLVGDMAHFALYDRALDSAEIARHYSAARPT
jgi:hypothetical protein